MIYHRRRFLPSVLSLAVVCTCAGSPVERVFSQLDSTPPAAVDSASARRAFAVSGFKIPESVQHDPRQDVYFVSNVGDGETAKDNNGFISRLRPDGRVDDLRFIAGGRHGAVLHAPKGIFITGDTLWVTDIDAVRAFDTRTGKPLASVDLAPLGARFLNDVTAGPGGALYITDTGLQFHYDGRVTHPGPDQIFRVGADRRGSVVLKADTLRLPNGIAWDVARERFIVVSLGGRSIFAWRPAATAPTLIGTGPGDFDGVVQLDNGNFLISSQADSAVYRLSDAGLKRVVGGLPNPGDIGLDRKRLRLLVPLLEAGRVEVWELRRSALGARRNSRR